MAQFDTVANIVGDVGTELGLGTLTVSYASRDESVLRLLKQLAVVGRGLVLRYPWLQNKLEYTFSTTATTTFALPADFLGMVDGTGWNRTSDLPLSPASPQQWQYLKATGTTGAVTVVVKTGFASLTGAPQLEFVVAPTAGDTIALEYRSRYWVAVSAAVAATLDAPTATTHVCRIDSHLLTRALRVAFLRSKGFDSTAALDDYKDALNDIRSANVGAAPVLVVGGKPRGGWMDESNAPSTGYGFDAGGLFP